MNCYTREQVELAVKDKGYVYFTGGNYDVNIIGIRNSNTLDEITNSFDDCMTLSYKIDNEWQFHCFKCTTDPGIYYSENLLNPDGVAILKPNQYRSTYQIGLHQGKYEALTQRLPVEVYRDNNRDDNYDLDEYSLQEGMFGINIHKAGSSINGSSQVDKWSAGCQVFSKESDFNEFMGIINKSKDIWGNSFTYTLIESEDIK
tara:strand:- start:473 stop:1078 length:606 start_codon:yes stop_codon:yes gene_type:complete